MKNEEIKDLIESQTAILKLQIKTSGDSIDVHMGILEKKIDNNHIVVDQIKKDTLVVRLIHQHPKISLFIVFLVVCGFIFLSKTIEFKDLLFFIKR